MGSSIYEFRKKTTKIQECIPKQGCRACVGEKKRKIFNVVNQLLSGHTRLKAHWSKITNSEDVECAVCRKPETIKHFIFDCSKYSQERLRLQYRTEEIQARSQGFEKGVRISPSTVIIDQQSGEGGMCGRGCPPHAMGGGGPPP
ncbi:hypothetical protein DPMN_029308 [Dreissena polymorpha]|uniref:Reverse transcriptase zinc-binding domain-containing protein n=1 Tax=Dreissena polymorpha TaxID=45954 RepID=A0A9D4RFC7_DREPO|nr:hypothetical protein DPMN_029308 [Dreissena polymorpha]